MQTFRHVGPGTREVQDGTASLELAAPLSAAKDLAYISLQLSTLTKGKEKKIKETF